MARKPSPSSGGSSRPDSPSSGSTAGSSRAGSSAAGRSGTRAGTRAGTTAGAAAGFNTDRNSAAPAGGTLASLPSTSRSRPLLLGLAIAGWTTFAVEWVVILTIVMGRGSSPRVAVAHNDNPPPRVAQSTPITPTPPTTTSRTTTTPRNTTNPTATKTPAANKANPFLNPEPNAMGMELNAGHTAILLDAVDRSEAWFEDGKAALAAGLTRDRANQTVSIVTIRDGEIGKFNGNPFKPGPSQLAPLNRFLNPLNTKGSSGLGKGIDTAVETGANEIIFITSRSDRWGGYLSTVEQKLQPKRGKVTLHVVQVGENSDELQAFVQGVNSGRYLRLTPEQLKTWRAAAK